VKLLGFEGNIGGKRRKTKMYLKKNDPFWDQGQKEEVASKEEKQG